MGNTNAKRVSLDNRDIKDNDYKGNDLQEAMEEIDFRRETKEPTGFLEIDDVHIDYIEATGKMQIAVANTDYKYFVAGEEFVVDTTLDILVPTTEGFHVFYLEKNNVITVTSNYTEPYNSERIRFAAVYYSVAGARVIYWANISSMLSMPWGTSQRISQVQGAQFNKQDFELQNFIKNSDGSLDSHAQFGLENGTIYHKDLSHDIIHSATPTNDWEQDISSIAKIPIYYRLGLGGAYRKKDATNFPLSENLGGRIYYNKNTAGTWSLAEAANNSFVAVYYYASLNPHEPIIGLLGDIEGTNAPNAISQPTKYWAGFPNATFAFIKIVVYHTADRFTNAVKARVFSITEGLDTISTDRYLATAFFGGNANNGRYLEYANGEDSEQEPLLVPEDSFIRTVTVQSVSNIGNGKSVGFYDANNLATPLFTVVIPSGGSKFHRFDVTEQILKDTLITVKIVNGSISKPVVRFWLETSA